MDLRASGSRGWLLLASIVAVLGGGRWCLAAEDHPMNFSVTLSPWTESVSSGSGQMSETFIVEASFTWTAPAGNVTYYRIWVDGAYWGLVPSGRTSWSVRLVWEVRILWPQDEAALYEEIIGSYLAAHHEFTLTADRLWASPITDRCEYLPPNLLRIGYAVTGVPESLPQPLDIVHEQGAAEEFDAQDLRALYGQSAGAARIASVMPLHDRGPLTLSRDARPCGSTSDVIVRLDLIPANGAPMTFAAPTHNELRLSIPTATYHNAFGNLPLTISFYDPCDPNRAYPSYDIRHVVSKYAGVLKLPDLNGSYDGNAPVAFLKVRFTTQPTADPNGGMQHSFPDPNAAMPPAVTDPNAPTTGGTDPNTPKPTAMVTSPRSPLLAANFPALCRQRQALIGG